MQLGTDDAAAADRTPVRPVAFEEAVPHDAGERLPAAMQALHGLKVQIQVRVGHAWMTVRDLLEARSGAVLELDRAVSEPVDLVLEGKVVARGHLVAVDDRFGVQVTELPLVPASASSSA